MRTVDEMEQPQQILVQRRKRVIGITCTIAQTLYETRQGKFVEVTTICAGAV